MKSSSHHFEQGRFVNRGKPRECCYLAFGNRSNHFVGVSEGCNWLDFEVSASEFLQPSSWAIDVCCVRHRQKPGQIHVGSCWPVENCPLSQKSGRCLTSFWKFPPGKPNLQAGFPKAASIFGFPFFRNPPVQSGFPLKGTLRPEGTRASGQCTFGAAHMQKP